MSEPFDADDYAGLPACGSWRDDCTSVYLTDRYEVLLKADGRTAITCFKCGLTSHNANDVEQRYCGKCHVFHDDAARAGAVRLREWLRGLTRNGQLP